VEIDAAAYFARLRELRGRFFEKDQFVESMQGKTVTWRGTVQTIRGLADTSRKVSIMLDVDPSTRDTFWADFGNERRTYIANLKLGDLIEVSGKIDSSSLLSILGHSLRRVG
jgi:hypothetical protein